MPRKRGKRGWLNLPQISIHRCCCIHGVLSARSASNSANDCHFGGNGVRAERFSGLSKRLPLHESAGSWLAEPDAGGSARRVPADSCNTPRPAPAGRSSPLRVSVAPWFIPLSKAPDYLDTT